MKNLQMLIYTKLYKKLCCSLLIICIKKCRRKPNFNNVRAILYAILQLCTQRNFFMRITKIKNQSTLINSNVRTNISEFYLDNGTLKRYSQHVT